MNKIYENGNLLSCCKLAKIALCCPNFQNCSSLNLHTSIIRIYPEYFMQSDQVDAEKSGRQLEN